MVASGLFGLVIGILLGLGYCYWKQLQEVYAKRDVISSGANLIGAAGDFWSNIKKL